MALFNPRKSLAVLLMLLYTITNVQAEDKVLTFGVVPQQSASKLAKVWGPVMSYIKDSTGIELRFKTAPNIPEFESRVEAGEYDFAYMNPYHYVVFSEKPGYQAIAKAMDKQIKGILVAGKDSKIEKIEDLNGQEIAFPSPAAFAASILPRAEMKKLGIQITPKYVSSHDSVYRNVATGLMVAGGGVQRTFNAFSPELQKQLKIIWTSKGYTPHAIAAHPRMDAKVVDTIQAALTDMQNSEAGQKLLEELKIKGWQAAVDKDWDDVRELNIPNLEAPVK
jgi:phosphonate transport system substrate-binding protein